MSKPPLSDPSTSGVFLTSEVLRQPEERGAAAAELRGQDLNEIRLLLGGDSVIDWHRLAFDSEDEVRRLFALNSIDLDDPVDRERIERVRAQAVRYIVDMLGLRLDEPIASEAPILQIPLIASKRGKYQRHACILLKLMHIIYHLDARELLTALSISDSGLFALVEESVVRMFDELRAAGVPVVEFSWSRKTRESQITKLLVKRETSAARVFDRLRFRLIVDNRDDLIPTLNVLLHRCIPFNYVVPGQTVNSLVDLEQVEKHAPPSEDLASSHGTGEFVAVPSNEFTGQGYKILNFVADLPVRVDDLLSPEDRERMSGRGRVVFVLAEFQIMDRATAEANDSGERSHSLYKKRQHQRVRERLLREPKHHD